MIRDRLYATVAAVAIASGINVTFAGLAQAQQTAQAGAVEEIIVTARKRAENLLEVPLSITAFTEADIEESGIDNVNDLANQTVGFSYKQGFGRIGSGQGGGSSNRPAIRGMSNIIGGPNAAFFVDGVFVSGNPSSYQLDNLQRIEVIRGPQSALFGRGTFAGAINFVTRKPTNEVQGKAEVTYGQHDHFEVNGYVSAPIVEDKLYGEISGRYYSFGGDYFNQVTQKKDIGDQKTKNFGAKLYATPTDALTIEANIGYAEDQDLGYADFFHGDAKNNCFLPRLTTPVFGIARNTIRSQGYFCGEIEIPANFFYFNDAIRAAGLWGTERIAIRSSLTADLEIGDWTLHSVTGYNHSEDNQLIDNFTDGARGAGNVTGGQSEVADWSQELRIQSPQDARLRGLAGVYYYKESFGSGFTRTVSSLAASLGRVTITNPYVNDATGVKNAAVFGMFDYDFTEQLTGSFEARYQEDKPQADNNVDGVVDTTPNGTLKTKYTAFLPRATLRYMLADDSNVYATIAKGNKPGGFNVVPLLNMAPADIARVFAEGAERYEEEKLWSYELGYKASLFDRRATVSSSVFWLDWTNQGLTNGFPYLRITPATPTTFARIVNAGKSRIRGIEIDTSVRPTDWFDFRVGYSYNEAEVRDYIDENERDLKDTDGRIGNEATQGDSNGQVRGNKIPQTPAHKLIVSGNLRYEFNDEVEAFFRSDLTYESNRWAQTHNLAGTGDSYLLNLKAGITNQDLTLTFFVNNALKDKTPLVVTRLFNFNRGLLVPDPVLTFAGQPLRFTFFRDFRVGAPRKQQFGATLLYKF